MGKSESSKNAEGALNTGGEALLRFGDTLDIDYPMAGAGILKMTCRVAQILDSHRIFASAPRQNGETVQFEPEDKVVLYFTHKQFGAYRCDAVVEKQETIQGIDFVHFRRIGDYERCQRREHFRLPIAREIEIRPIPAGGEAPEAMPSILPMALRDVSAGGMRGIVREPLEIKSRMRIRLPLADETFELTGETIMRTKIEFRRGEYEVRVRFVQIDERLRGRLVQRLFEEQRRQLRIFRDKPLEPIKPKEEDA